MTYSMELNSIRKDSIYNSDRLIEDVSKRTDKHGARIAVINHGTGGKQRRKSMRATAFTRNILMSKNDAVPNLCGSI